MVVLGGGVVSYERGIPVNLKPKTLNAKPEYRSGDIDFGVSSSSSSLLLSSLHLSATKVYQPQIRALLGTASQFCEVVVLESRIKPET